MLKKNLQTSETNFLRGVEMCSTALANTGWPLAFFFFFSMFRLPLKRHTGVWHKSSVLGVRIQYMKRSRNRPGIIMVFILNSVIAFRILRVCLIVSLMQQYSKLALGYLFPIYLFLQLAYWIPVFPEKGLRALKPCRESRGENFCVAHFMRKMFLWLLPSF